MLKNKTVIVTGAGQGIGRGIALALAKEGANVAAADINEENCQKTAKEIKGLGVKSLAVKCDVSNAGEVNDMVEAVEKEFGGLDIMVNNAGIFPFVAFEKMTGSDWDKVINVNLKSVFLCSKAASGKMKEGGRIITITSIAAEVGFEGLAHYCASKGGITAFTRALALELAPKKITVNAIAPGAIDTPGASGANEEAVKQTVAAVPLGRMGKPEDIGNAAVFLASDKSDYITGQVITVDGGYTLR